MKLIFFLNIQPMSCFALWQAGRPIGKSVTLNSPPELSVTPARQKVTTIISESYFAVLWGERERSRPGFVSCKIFLLG